VADSNITVNITIHDPTHGWVDCPLQNSEYGICVAHDFLHPPTRPNQPGMKCPEDISSTEYIHEEGEQAGLCMYAIPSQCPLRAGAVRISGV